MIDLKPTKDQFHAYVDVQLSGKVNMFSAHQVILLAKSRSKVDLTKDNLVYIMNAYADLIKEYGSPLQCEVCGRHVVSTRVRNCGFSEEIHGTEVEETICDDCEHEHLMDV